MSRKIAFGTDGWRAVIADGFTMENVRIVAKAIALYTLENHLEERGMIIGHDTRFMGRHFAQEVVRVLATHKIKCYLVNEPTPTPVVAFGVKHFATSGAVMLTASHNPPEYNGIKYIPDYAGPATPDITNRLEQLIAHVQASGGADGITLKEASPREYVEYIYLRPHYEAHIRRYIDFAKIRETQLQVMVDSMHGAGMGYVSTLLDEAGATVNSLREKEDPLFGGGMPEPNEKHLTELRMEVVSGEYDLGLANDGDGDRFGVIDRLGRYIPPNQVLVLLAHHLIHNRGLTGRIVRTVATTHLLDRIAAKHGLELVETPVGFKYIGAEMLKGDVLIGGEESGGASVLHHIPEKDGIFINMLVAEMCAWEKKPLDELVRKLHNEYGEMHHTRMDIHLTEKETWLTEILSVPPTAIGPFAVVGIDRKDGVKFLLDGGNWVLVRLSGTEPLIRIYCEASTLDELEKLKESIQDWFIGVHV